MTEMVDIFDEDENKLGTVTRREASDNNLRRRIAEIFVFNSKGQMLIHKRSADKSSDPGLWDFKCGGWVGSGEDPAISAQREAKEELNINTPLEFACKTRYETDRVNEIDYVYKTVFDGDVKVQESEVAEFEWAEPPDIWKLMQERHFCPNNVDRYQVFAKQELLPEMVDIFDEDENKVDTVTKDEAFNKNLLRRGCGVMVFNSKGELLIMKRADDKKVAPGHWDFFAGGWVQSGEDPKDGALRELKEETGVVTKIDFMFKYRFKTDIHNDFSYIYRAEYDGEIACPDEEVSKYEWVSLDEVPGIMVSRKIGHPSKMIYEKYWNQVRK